MRYLGPFSLSMLRPGYVYDLCIRAISSEKARELVSDGCVSLVRYEPLARVLSCILGYEVATSPISIALQKDDMLIVGQYIGPLPNEDATATPQGARIHWWLVEVARQEKEV